MSGVMRLRKGWSLAFLVSFGAALAAPPPAKAATPLEDFEVVFEAYEQQLAGRHYAAAIPYAEQALKMARQSGAFGENFIHTLTANLGKMYFMVGRWADAERAFDGYLAARTQPSGQKLDEYLSVLLQAGTAKRELGRARQALPLFQRALKHLDRRDKARRPARADTLKQLTLVLLELKQADQALETGEEAYELYEKLHGRKDIRTLESGLTLARTEVLLLKNDDARSHLKRIDEGLHKNDKLRDWQKAGLHGRIAALYENMQADTAAERHRNKSEAFLRGVGDVELEVKSGPPPEYPRRAAEAEITGTVEVEYTVLKNGDLDDLRIVHSSPRGVFDEAVLKALKKWRYKPPRQDGERVNYPGVRKKIKFRVPEG